MRVLLVEDDEYKQVKIEEVIRNIVHNCEMTVARNVRDAVLQMQGKQFDHIILDIALPSHESLPGGGSGLPMPSGGIEVLLEISYQNRTDPVTILTQYPEIEFDGKLLDLKRARLAFKRSVNAEIVDVIHFEMDSAVWENFLIKAVLKNA